MSAQNPSPDPSPDQHKSMTSRISRVIAAVSAAVAAAAVLRAFPVATPLIAAVAGGAFAYTILDRLADTERSGIHVWIVFLSAGCAGFACWTIMLSRKQATPAVATTHPAHVHILQPASEQYVSDEFDQIRGVVTNLNQGEILWLMVQTVGEQHYYLMPTPCSITPRDRWTCERVYVGPDSFDQHFYRIIVCIMDGLAQQEAINDWAAAVRAGRNYVAYSHPLGRSGADVIVHRRGPP